jgi:hypothetical protein
MSDIRVVAVKTGIVFIEDIGVDVPYGNVVSIPAEQALRSKDLYRYLSQRVLFQLHAGAVHGPSPMPLTDLPKPEPAPPAPPPGSQRDVALDQQVSMLRAALEQREAVFVAVLSAQQAQFAEVLEALRRQPQTIVVQATPHGATHPALSSMPSTDAPMFIPSEIKPKDVDARVNIESTSQESGVADASAALRRLRGGRQSQ